MDLRFVRHFSEALQQAFRGGAEIWFRILELPVVRPVVGSDLDDFNQRRIRTCGL